MDHQNTTEGRYSSPFKATVTGIVDLFRKPKNAVALLPEERLDGKTVLITGASSGLGLATAIQLAERGARLIMACRSGIPEKGELVKAASGNRDITMIHVDLSDLGSIDRLVDTLTRNARKVDIIICNAAIVPAKSRKGPQGIEEMFAVNYLAKYLLVRLLLDSRRLGGANRTRPRIIFVSSESHRNPDRFAWEEFGTYHEYGMGKTVELYGYYKLLLTTFANELSRRLNPDGNVTHSVFALCPGPVNSNIAREAPSFLKPLLRLVFALFFRSPKKAAFPVVYFACSKEVEGKAIDYLFLSQRKEMDGKAMDIENGERLWTLTEDFLRDYGFTFDTL